MTKQANEKTIEIIRKLLALADASKNNQEHEAALALAKAQEMMKAYRLSMSDVDVRDIAVEQWISPEMSQLDTFKKSILHGVTKLFSCQWLIYRGNAHNKYRLSISIIGESTDVEVCRQVYDWLVKKCSSLARQRYGSVWGVSHRCFVEAFAHTILQRCLELVRRQVWEKEGMMRQSQPVEPTVSQEDQKWALVLAKKEDAVDLFMQEKFPDLKNERRQKRCVSGYDECAAMHGSVEGHKVDLNFRKGIGNNEPVDRMIK